MKLCIAALAFCVLGAFTGCDGVVVVRDGYRPHHVVYVQPAVQPQPYVYDDATPPYVEEGTVVNGNVVVEPVGVDYVYVNDTWFYYNSDFHTWVHAHHVVGWQPKYGRVYHNWNEHPAYHRIVASRR